MYKRMIAHGVTGIGVFWLLYRNIWAALAGMVLFALYSVIFKKELSKKRIEKTREGFLDFLICLQPLLKTTGTFPGAFTDAASDYRKFHGNDSVSRQLDSAVNGFRMNRTTGEVLDSLGENLNIEEAVSFAGSIAICESTGGDTVEITERTVNLLIHKIRVIRDINTSLSGRIFEQKIITLMPFVLLLVFSYASESYIELMYTDIRGPIIMTTAGGIFLVQWIAGRKIMDIRV